MGRLDEVDLSLEYDTKEGLKKLEKAQRRLALLRLTLGGQIGSGQLGPPVCVVMEGWDASGKGGAIQRMVQNRLNRLRCLAPGARRRRPRNHVPTDLLRIWPSRLARSAGPAPDRVRRRR